MNQMLHLDRLNEVSSLLSSGLPATPAEDIPEEVAATLSLAREQMSNLPLVIADLIAARRNFDTLDLAIDRLLHLAELAGELPEEDQAGREALEVEFIHLAGVVARVAGRGSYAGPELTLATQAGARAAQRILKYLVPVKEDMAARLIAQTELLVMAVTETVTFLEAVTVSFPDAASLTMIPDLLQRVKWLREVGPADDRPGHIPPSGLH